jgi:hypothetical protein
MDHYLLQRGILPGAADHVDAQRLVTAMGLFADPAEAD